MKKRVGNFLLIGLCFVTTMSVGIAGVFAAGDYAHKQIAQTQIVFKAEACKGSISGTVTGFVGTEDVSYAKQTFDGTVLTAVEVLDPWTIGGQDLKIVGGVPSDIVFKFIITNETTDNVSMNVKITGLPALQGNESNNIRLKSVDYAKIENNQTDSSLTGVPYASSAYSYSISHAAPTVTDHNGSELTITFSVIDFAMDIGAGTIDFGIELTRGDATTG